MRCWVRKSRSPCSCRMLILVYETTETIPANNSAKRNGLIDIWTRGIRDREIQAAMRPRSVVVLDIGVQHFVEMTSPGDQKPVEALWPHGSHPAFGDGIRPWRLNGGADHFHSLCPKDLVKGGGELGISVVNEETERLFSIG